jgi:hypothetical protein
MVNEIDLLTAEIQQLKAQVESLKPYAELGEFADKNISIDWVDGKISMDYGDILIFSDLIHNIKKNKEQKND